MFPFYGHVISTTSYGYLLINSPLSNIFILCLLVGLLNVTVLTVYNVWRKIRY